MNSIVIFGATSAIAQATARLFAQRCDRIALVGRNLARLNAIADDLRVRGAELVHVLEADLANPSQFDVLFATIESQLGRIDVALIAYGTLLKQEVCEQSFEPALEQFQSNFVSPALLAERTAQYMAKWQGGTLAAISSVAGDRGRQSNYYYGAAKGGLSVFLQGLRNRVHAKGVNVLTIKPGFVDTPMTHDFTKGPLWVGPDTIARGIVKAIDSRKHVVYLPWFWTWIMLVIRHIPERIFVRLKL